MLKPILDTIRQANVESIDDRYRKMLAEAEYECFGCGEWTPVDQIEERIARPFGEPETILFCTSCINKKRDQLL